MVDKLKYSSFFWFIESEYIYKNYEMNKKTTSILIVSKSRNYVLTGMETWQFFSRMFVTPKENRVVHYYILRME